MFIYDLDNENGGQILSDSNTTAPALQVNSNAAGYPAIAVLSTASVAAIKVTGINLAAIDVDNGTNAIGIDADSSSTTNPAGDFRSSASVGPALIVGRTVNGTASVAAMQYLGTSAASAAIIGFKGGFISLTSLVLTTVANFDYAIPVELAGEQRFIPVIKAAGIVGAAAF